MYTVLFYMYLIASGMGNVMEIMMYVHKIMCAKKHAMNTFEPEKNDVMISDRGRKRQFP